MTCCLVCAGWLDNAGSFDGLIPLLSLPSPHVVAIDLPGHGLSSHRPPGTNAVFLNYLTDVRRVVDGEIIWLVRSLASTMTTPYATHPVSFDINIVHRLITLMIF